MRPLQGVGPTVAGFVVAMLATLALVQFDFTRLPGLDESAPREIPVAVVGPGPDGRTMRDALNGPADHPLAARMSSSVQHAEQSLRSRDVSAVLVMGPENRHELWLASAGGAAEAERVEQVVARILAVSGQRAAAVDVLPVTASDPDGLGPVRLGSGWAILGVALAGLLGYTFGARSPGPGLAVVRSAALAAGAVVAGIGGALVATRGREHFDAPFWPLAGLGALTVLGVGMVTLGLIAWFDRLGLVLAAGGVIVGIPGALGAWPLDPISTVWPTILAWLPPGAATWGISGLAYFDGAGVARVVWVSLLWIAVGLGAVLVAADTAEQRAGVRGLHPRFARHPLIGAGAAVVAFAACIVFPAAPAFTTEDLDPALEVTCQSIRLPRNVEELNRQVTSVSDYSGLLGGDVGASTRLADGRLLFVYGDTLRQPGYGRQPMVRNSMLVFRQGCAGVLERRDRGAAIPDRADGVGYWPMSVAAVELDGNDLVAVLAQRVERTGDDEFDFQNLGPALAIFHVETGRPPVLQRVMDMGPDDPDRSRPTWGAAATVEGDTVYVYGTSRTSPGFGWGVSVARVDLDDFTDQSAWRYWDGSQWQDDDSRAVTVIGQDQGVSQTFSVFREDDTWYALSKRDDFAGTDLIVWSAPGPTGPFTPSEPLAEIPSTADELRYMPLAHPQILEQEGTMVVSVSRNSTDTAAILADPSLYRPEFLRVTLP